eukprot:Hpha_TRINITY_DN33514_c0_g1::TRINITY_DN33514_c0_g1_i1::g.171042::m.171042
MGSRPDEAGVRRLWQQLSQEVREAVAEAEVRRRLQYAVTIDVSASDATVISHDLSQRPAGTCQRLMSVASAAGMDSVAFAAAEPKMAGESTSPGGVRLRFEAQELQVCELNAAADWACDVQVVPGVGAVLCGVQPESVLRVNGRPVQEGTRVVSVGTQRVFPLEGVAPQHRAGAEARALRNAFAARGSPYNVGVQQPFPQPSATPSAPESFHDLCTCAGVALLAADWTLQDRVLAGGLPADRLADAARTEAAAVKGGAAAAAVTQPRLLSWAVAQLQRSTGGSEAVTDEELDSIAAELSLPPAPSKVLSRDKAERVRINLEKDCAAVLRLSSLLPGGAELAYASVPRLAWPNARLDDLAAARAGRTVVYGDLFKIDSARFAAVAEYLCGVVEGCHRLEVVLPAAFLPQRIHRLAKAAVDIRFRVEGTHSSATLQQRADSFGVDASHFAVSENPEDFARRDWSWAR